MCKFFFAFAATLLASGCVSKSAVVRTRAAFDMSCSEQELQVVALSSEIMDTATYGVRGCGKKAAYIFTPAAGAVLNSPVESDVAKPQ